MSGASSGSEDEEEWEEDDTEVGFVEKYSKASKAKAVRVEILPGVFAELLQEQKCTKPAEKKKVKKKKKPKKEEEPQEPVEHFHLRDWEKPPHMKSRYLAVTVEDMEKTLGSLGDRLSQRLNEIGLEEAAALEEQEKYSKERAAELERLNLRRTKAEALAKRLREEEEKRLLDDRMRRQKSRQDERFRLEAERRERLDEDALLAACAERQAALEREVRMKEAEAKRKAREDELHRKPVVKPAKAKKPKKKDDEMEKRWKEAIEWSKSFDGPNNDNEWKELPPVEIPEEVKEVMKEKAATVEQMAKVILLP